MRNWQKQKEVRVKVFYARNGHFKGDYTFNCELSAKRFIESLLKENKAYYFMVADKYNGLYKGNGYDYK